MALRKSEIIPSEIIESKIYLIRGLRVMFDSDLAKLYGVSTKVLIQAVKRNIKRFPVDFMFQLNKSEFVNLRSQIVTSSWGGRRYLPYAFTEHGVAMLSSVLKSERAIQVNIQIIRTFVRLRRMVLGYEDLKRKIDDLERRLGMHDVEIRGIFDAIRQLMSQPEQHKRKIGFVRDEAPPPLPSPLKSRPKDEDSRNAEGEEKGGGERWFNAYSTE